MLEIIQNNFPSNIGVLKQNQPADLECLKTQINSLDNASQKNNELTKDALKALSPIIPVRRLSSLPDNINDGNYARAAGLIGVMALNLPEDTRDLKSAAKQIFKGTLPKYDYKNYQAPFSFFRGTVLEPVVNKMGKLGVKLHEWDKPLESTKFGEFLKKIFKFDVVDDVSTGRFVPKVILDESGKLIPKDIEVFASKIEGKTLSKLIGNALLRMPVISVFVMGALEIPAIAKAFSKSENSKDKAINGCNQILKSGVNVSSILTGIGIFGALLKNRGPVGSLIGMGIGSVAGAYASKTIQNKIDNITVDKKLFHP